DAEVVGQLALAGLPLPALDELHHAHVPAPSPAPAHDPERGRALALPVAGVHEDDGFTSHGVIMAGSNRRRTTRAGGTSPSAPASRSSIRTTPPWVTSTWRPSGSDDKKSYSRARNVAEVSPLGGANASNDR